MIAPQFPPPIAAPKFEPPRRRAVPRARYPYAELISVVTLLVLPLASYAAEPSLPSLRVMSWNIRFDNPSDGPNAWPHRRDAVAQLLKTENVDVAGLQEALKSQIDDLAERLPDYAWYGVGRDDGREKGEYGPIFYRRDRLVAEDQGQFWLSEKPDEPGRLDWGAACSRMATWVVFRDLKTDQRFVFYNTHFDHVSDDARRKGAELIRNHVAQNPVPLRVVVGDLNALPESAPVTALLAPTGDDATPVLRAAYDIATSRSGPETTWTGFRQLQPNRRIDHVFVSGPVRVESHRILEARIGDRFASDHLPLLADITIEANSTEP